MADKLDVIMKRALEAGTLYRVRDDATWEGMEHDLRGFLVEIVQDWGGYNKAGFDCEARILAPIEAVAQAYGWDVQEADMIFGGLIEPDTGLLVLEWDKAEHLEPAAVGHVAHFAADTGPAGGGYADDGLLVWALREAAQLRKTLRTLGGE